MKEKERKRFMVAMCFIGAFALWTLLVRYVDVQDIGPENTTVGFATVNGFFHRLTGAHMWLYTLTDWLSLIPVGCIAGFGLLGLKQWILRRKLWKVDRSILALGGFYLVVLAAYVLFEQVAINYRPILIGGVLEASYPSSTTLLTMCVMPTATMQLRERIGNPALRRWISCAITVFTACMVLGRLLSGVHWLTDIIGGAILSTGLVMLYAWASGTYSRHM